MTESGNSLDWKRKKKKKKVQVQAEKKANRTIAHLMKNLIFFYSKKEIKTDTVGLSLSTRKKLRAKCNCLRHSSFT